MRHTLIGRALAVAIGPRALRVLQQHRDSAQADLVFEDALHRYHERAQALPHEEAFGGRVMVHAAALTVSLYEALLEHGANPTNARRETAEVTATVYELMAEVPWLFARASSRAPLVRLRRATDGFRRFPFGSPSYEMHDVEAPEGTVAFDVVRCPVAEYFRAEGLADLCVASWCALDFPLATKWGATLERSTTLAEGADFCDFRWHVLEPAARRRL